MAFADLLAKDFGGVVQEDVAIGVGSVTFLTEPRSVLASVLEHLAGARDDEPCPGGFLFDVGHTDNFLLQAATPISRRAIEIPSHISAWPSGEFNVPI